MNTLIANIGASEVLLIAGGVSLSILLIALWIWMLVNCIQRLTAGDNQMIAWLVVLLLTNAIGAAIYGLVAYRRISSNHPSAKP
jgi:uncharacterized membrane protein